MRLAGRSVVVMYGTSGGSMRRGRGTRRESGNAALCRPRSSSANQLRTTEVLHITQRVALYATARHGQVPSRRREERRPGRDTVATCTVHAEARAAWTT